MTMYQKEGAASAGYILTCEDPARASTPVRIGSQASGLQNSGDGNAPHPAISGEVLLDALRYVVFDTETTGLNPSEGDEIISIAAVAIVGGRILHKEFYDQLVDPERELKASSIKVHGITPELLAGQPKIGEVLPEFSSFAHDAVLVAHNAAFDMRFLKNKEQSTGVRFQQPVLDTLLLSSVLHPTQTSHSLDTLLERYGIKESGRHTALGDALMTAELFLKLLPQLKARGLTTLSMVLEASRKSPLARIKF
jgi:DNA polymerase-3 subunit epsilon